MDVYRKFRPQKRINAVTFVYFVSLKSSIRSCAPDTNAVAECRQFNNTNIYCISPNNFFNANYDSIYSFRCVLAILFSFGSMLTTISIVFNCLLSLLCVSHQKCMCFVWGANAECSKSVTYEVLF